LTIEDLRNSDLFDSLTNNTILYRKLMQLVPSLDMNQKIVQEKMRQTQQIFSDKSGFPLRCNNRHSSIVNIQFPVYSC